MLNEITLCGYKSIESLKNFELRNLNVLIGANGAGKSNFISLFKLLAEIANGDLQFFISKQGGADTFLRGGRKLTHEIKAEFYFGSNGYQMILAATVDNRLIFKKEKTLFCGDLDDFIYPLGEGHEETKLTTPQPEGSESVKQFVLEALRNWRVYHFHDTSQEAKVKSQHHSNDNIRLQFDAGNLAAYLSMLKKNYPNNYHNIVETIRLAAPFFGDFVIREPLPSKVRLEWTERGDSDRVCGADLLSDGTLRFICLTTLLLQPIELLPATILIDEPELGLHPYAIALLAAMIQQVAEQKQIILSTQSVELLNQFSAEDIIVVDRKNDASVFTRLDSDKLKNWLADYTLGELWKSNVIAGRPLS